MAKILILIGAHLCTAPRPQKEAETLANAGHDVTVRGFWFDPELVKRDRLLIANHKWKFEPIIDFQPTNRWLNWKMRLQRRIAQEQFQRLGNFSPGLLGYGVKAMLTAARKARADLTIAHSEASLWVGSQLLNEGLRVGVDFEDWFSEDLPPSDRNTRPIAKLKLLEQRLLRECTYCLTTSHAMAEAMAKAYQAPKPTVIYNSFPWSDRTQIDGHTKDRQNHHLPSLHWFSHTIGPHRGLEILFQALSYLKIPVEVHLRGNYPQNSRQWLETVLPVGWVHETNCHVGIHYLYIHPTVSSTELLSRIAEHDIGLALEVPYCFNKQFTTSNKLFQYLQAGIAVIATDTVGQREILSQHPVAGHLIPNQDPLSLAAAIEDLLQTPGKLTDAKAAALEAAKNQFSWEREAKNLSHLLGQALCH